MATAIQTTWLPAMKNPGLSTILETRRMDPPYDLYMTDTRPPTGLVAPTTLRFVGIECQPLFSHYPAYKRSGHIPKVRPLFCRVPERTLSRTPWDSLPIHLCRFTVRSPYNMTTNFFLTPCFMPISLARFSPFFRFITNQFISCEVELGSTGIPDLPGIPSYIGQTPIVR